jgi:hypothetical protein
MARKKWEARREIALRQAQGGWLQKVKDPTERLWYAAKTLEHGWSRAVLTQQIESDLFGRKGKAVTNFRGMANQAIPLLARTTPGELAEYRGTGGRTAERGSSLSNACCQPFHLTDDLLPV